MSRVWSFVEDTLAWTGAIFIVCGLLTMVNMAVEAREKQLAIEVKQAELEAKLETCRADYFAPGTLVPEKLPAI